jgi:hypothetical protein
LGIEQLFVQSLATLREIRGEILDVKSSRWLERYSRFKQVTRDLEVHCRVWMCQLTSYIGVGAKCDHSCYYILAYC